MKLHDLTRFPPSKSLILNSEIQALLQENAKLLETQSLREKQLITIVTTIHEVQDSIAERKREAEMAAAAETDALPATPPVISMEEEEEGVVPEDGEKAGEKWFAFWFLLTQNFVNVRFVKMRWTYHDCDRSPPICTYACINCYLVSLLLGCTARRFARPWVHFCATPLGHHDLRRHRPRQEFCFKANQNHGLFYKCVYGWIA